MQASLEFSPFFSISLLVEIFEEENQLSKDHVDTTIG